MKEELQDTVSVVGAVRWRDIACGLAEALEELSDYVLGDVPGFVGRMLKEFNEACDEDDPEGAL